ncbi:lumican [Esox lucius]|uniref:LRRNT domain-containing protein n=1 Tax=Esox lucius TaxID=8010 RepID=A0A3P8ZET1_ESOLU|nr:lumican [Esox lucius]
MAVQWSVLTMSIASVLGLVLSVCCPVRGSPGVSQDLDYGGVPLWINRLLGEPSVLSLQGRMDRAWYRANNPDSCPDLCDCPIQWPTALYCDHGHLEKVPDSLLDNTQYLFLQGNNISYVPSSSFTNSSGLRWLILDHNNLQGEGLQPDTLQNLTQLKYLFLNHNKLTAVPSGLPSSLRQLRLAHNLISIISPGTFGNLSNLTMLLLQGNRLSVITETDLTGLVSVNLLDLSGNRFFSFPSYLPPSIQQLYLSNNSLSGLEENSLRGFANLKFLRLSHCGLLSPSIHRQSFNLSSLVELDLSYNKLTTIPLVPSTLQYLYLEANHIQEFNVSSFCSEVGPLSYSRMKILRLDGNQMSYHLLPTDWVYCLRVLHHIYI